MDVDSGGLTLLHVGLCLYHRVSCLLTSDAVGSGTLAA
jgi:hypothetical protein